MNCLMLIFDHCLLILKKQIFVFNKDYSVEIMDSNCEKILTIKYGHIYNN